MIDFTNRDYDILICTTIIETGIDIPTVNTLIIIWHFVGFIKKTQFLSESSLKPLYIM